ncbi:putative G-protein coupled receptor 157 [Triangularia verruculosa]|uniref:G-protein coupled receptor 157 n=1 Tax=Triangularia verruculosa TaxID=2587418 RepID=A0AAN6XGM8_9PEZI|nr:putative G-protein coupled receptor 157 [Triangularia verruculosa]
MSTATDDPRAELPVDVFSIIERTCSVFSLLGSVLVITTFCASKAFHKPINRLVFYASFGNLMTNAATLMARSFVNDPNSGGCQFQGFLIQMFMPADTFWTLAMAVNVYLTFYFKFDGTRLRRMEIPYLLCCYGIPFVVALTFLFIQTPAKGKMYGNATLWCWISPKWDIFRIATFYGPIWIVILITFFIYIRAGREIYKKHQQLKDFSTGHHDHEPFAAGDDPFNSVKTTEVSVTSEVIDQSLATLGIVQNGTEPPKLPNAAYSVHISSNRRAAERDSYGDTPPSNQHNIRIDSQAPPIRNATTGGTNTLRRRAAYEANNATWSYAKCSILFFTAMLVTWIPSSANRVYSVVHKNQASLALEYMSAFVLPLQGFWNSIIYIVTSWKACQILWDDAKAWFGHKDQQLVGDGSFQMMSSARNGFKHDKTYETESMTELAGSSSHAEDRSPIELPSKTLERD